GGRDEQATDRFGQAERIGQQHGGVLAGGAVDSALQVTDRPRAQARRFCQLLLGELGLGPQLPQQSGERKRRLLRHCPSLPRNPSPSTAIRHGTETTWTNSTQSAPPPHLRILSACLSDFTTSSLTRTTCPRWPGSGRKRSAGRFCPSASAR